MSEELLIRNCSPTLAGMKAGSMFSCTYQTQEELLCDICRLNQMLSHKGIRILLLRCRAGRALVYVFRPNAVAKVLEDETAVSLLKNRGYCQMSLGPCIRELMQRLQKYEEFPHEVGLFLGYPPEDVRGFIENCACHQKCVGCWKVYGDEAAARKTFAKYKKCTDVYCEQWEKGKSIERLTVAG